MSYCPGCGNIGFIYKPEDSLHHPCPVCKAPKKDVPRAPKPLSKEEQDKLMSEQLGRRLLALVIVFAILLFMSFLKDF